MSKSKLSVINFISVSFMMLGSFLIMLSLLVDYNTAGIKSKLSYFASFMFWLFIISAWVMQFISYKSIKEHVAYKSRPAVIKFFSNKFAVIADTAMIILLVLTFTFFVINKNEVLQVLLLSLFIFAFQLHIVLNGKNFRYLYSLKTNLGKEEKSNEKH